MQVDLKTLNQSAKKLTKKSKSNFYFSFLFLSKEKREAIYNIYAFCRYSDDIADQTITVQTRKKQFVEWRSQLDACYLEQAKTPMMIEISKTIKDFNIPREYMDDLIAGVEMDLTKNRYDTFDALYEYCYKVASVVGLICIEIFGYENIKCKKYAEYLGVALQLTNILRDVGNDANRDRIYLPQEELDLYKISEKEILEKNYSEGFFELMAFQRKRAESFYIKAQETLPFADSKNMLAAEIMGAIYHKLLENIYRAKYRVFDRTIVVPTYEKVLICSRMWLRNLFVG